MAKTIAAYFFVDKRKNSADCSGMAKQDTGGPAFPIVIEDRDITMNRGVLHDGMSLRDWFAGMALAAKTEPGLIGYEDHAPKHRAELIRRLVRDAWEIADEAIKQRNAD